ncbi:MAG: carboxypeptidase-like regulatory domain-containing protein [Candidatus Aenigmatarchaeota archaeon]
MNKKLALAISIIIFSIILLSSKSLIGGQQSIKGKIEPSVFGATIYAKQGGYPSTSDTNVHIIEKTQSNLDGNFVIKNLPPGGYDLMVKAQGYLLNTGVSKITVIENQKFYILVILFLG